MTELLSSEETRSGTSSVDRSEEPIHAMFVSTASCTGGPDVYDNDDFASWVDLGMNQSLIDSIGNIYRADNKSMYSPLVSETEQRIRPVTYYTTVHERASLFEVLDEKEIMLDSSTSLASIPSRTCSISIFSLGDPYRLPNMKREDSMLFHYYVAEMCPHCIVRNGFNKNYRQVLLPLANKSNILLKAILAFTANRLKLQDDRFQTVALRHQSAVLQGLQQSLNNKKRTSFSRLELLSTILMLCFYEIYNAGQSPKDLHGLPTRPWMTHAGGVRRLLDLGTVESHDSHYEKAVVSFLSQYFASRSVLAFTSLSPLEDGVEIVDHAWYWLGMADRPPQEINPFAGCSNEMLTSILVITARMRQIGRSQSQPLPSLQQTSANMMAKSLFAMDQHPPAESRDGDTSAKLQRQHADQTPTNLLGKTSEAFRLATVVLLGNLYPEIDLEAHEQTRICLDRLDEILDSGIAVPERGALGSSSYMWPYFIAGLHLQSLDHNASLARRIRQLLSRNDTASGQILCVLEEIWPLLVGHKVAARSSGYSFLWESAMLNRHQLLEWV
ncbi:hypothetical protein CcaCcLH18_13395 [Colletotrichum camelliae]|nr:hypothetical protein CcaCcLH18_13395 [Colletotrichum camelliae]